MSRQLKNIIVNPLTDQLVQVTTDQTDYAPEEALNKVIIRTPDHWPLDKGTVHMMVRDGYGIISAVNSTDPLQVESSGFGDFDIDGYDGLVISSDGYVLARGVIKTSTTANVALRSPIYVSSGNNHWLLGGTISGVNVQTVWHSFTGKTWELLPNAPFAPGSISGGVTNGDDLWVIGEWNFLDTVQEANLWHAKINLSTGELTWDPAAIATEIATLNGEFFKPTINPDEGTNGHIYVGIGKVDISDGSFDGSKEIHEDTTDRVIHYDTNRNILWSSAGGIRLEQIVDEDGTHHEVGQHAQAIGYVHRQETPAMSWVVTHNMLSTDVAPICYDDTKQLLSPASAHWIDNNSLQLNWNKPKAGRAMICHAQHYTGTTWNLADGYLDNNSAWMVIKNNGDIVEPLATPTSSQMTWSSSTDGYLVAWTPYNGIDVVAGRRHIASGDLTVGVNTREMWQQTELPLTWFRTTDTVPDLLEPLSYDYTDNNLAQANFNSDKSDIRWSSLNMRHDGYIDNQDPFSPTTYNSLGVNSNTTDTVYMIGDNGVWSSGDAGVAWSRQTATDANFPTTRLTPVLVNGNMVAGLDDSDLTARSLTGGIDFEIHAGLSTQTITWYDDLGVPVDTTYRLFVYERPSDVTWESQYGFLPGDINDDYTTHYVLPYPTVIDAGNIQSIAITLDTVYARSVTLNEFEGDWLYLITKTTGDVVERKQILRNTAGAAGGSITIYPKTLSTTPTAAHVIQIIKSRAEGPVYYRALSRDAALSHTLHHEVDGAAFINSQEQEQDYYAHLKSFGGLPSEVQSDENLARINSLHVELNRQRVEGRQFYNDQDLLPPALLQRLGNQIGIELDENIDLQSQRRIVSMWHDQVDSYGPCLDGVNNLIDLILGPDSGVSAALSSPNADTLSGQILTVDISEYANFQWAYSSSTNSIIYDRDLDRFGMEVSVTDVAADIGELVHYDLVHFRGTVVDGPMLITDYDFNVSTNEINIYTEGDRISEISLSDGESTLGVYDAPRSRRTFKFTKLLRQLLPFWIQLKLS